MNRQYDKSFAQEGAKIGDELKIRLPNQYQVFDGADMSANFQDTTERSASLKIDSQKVVPMAFTDKDLTLSLDDFSERIIEPAMAVLAANIEADVAVRMKNSIYNQVNNHGADVSLRKILDGGKILTDNLAPRDKKRATILSTQDNVVLVDTLKGTFTYHPKDGYGRNLGRWFNNSLLRTQLQITSPTLVFHSIRHTVAQQLRNNKVQEATLKDILGHAHANSTRWNS